MKRPTYFISARSPSADVMASELVLALREQFTKVDGIGITGLATGRTKITGIAKLEECMQHKLHESTSWSQGGKELVNFLEEALTNGSPELAILVGYSPLHHHLASFFKQQKIPVVLYGMTPSDGWQCADPNNLHLLIDRALGMFPRPTDLLAQTQVPYTYVGSPFRDRADRVFISRRSLGLPDGQPIVSFLPGARLDQFELLFPLMLSLAAALKSQRPDLCLILPLADSVFTEAKTKIFDSAKIQPIDSECTDFHFNYENLLVKRSMALEILSLSQVAITGTGAATIECCLFQVPFIALHHESSSRMQSLVNQVWERLVVPEFELNTVPQDLCQRLVTLIDDSPERTKMLKDFEEVKASLQGFAAENAAEIIGQEIAEWHLKKRSKDSRTA